MVFPWRGEIPGSCPDAVRYHALFRDQRNDPQKISDTSLRVLHTKSKNALRNFIYESRHVPDLLISVHAGRCRSVYHVRTVKRFETPDSTVVVTLATPGVLKMEVSLRLDRHDGSVIGYAHVAVTLALRDVLKHPPVEASTEV